MSTIKYYNKMPFRLYFDNKPKPPMMPGQRYSITALTSSSGLIKPYTRIVDDFNRMYSRRAYMHHYGGIDFEQFNEALEDLYSLIKDFEVTTWDYNNFDIGEEEEEEEEE